MNYILFVLIGLLVALVALMVYVRLAPIKGDVWHKIDLPQGPAGEATGVGSHTVLRDVINATAALRQMDEIILATPRTTRVAGDVNDGKITYITRTQRVGFPDYTTVEAQVRDGADMQTLAMYGRLRFGQSDLGVNRARITGWLAQFDEANG